MVQTHPWLPCFSIFAAVAQSVERRLEKPGVEGSIPSCGTNFHPGSSVAEQRRDMAWVNGSSPFPGTNSKRKFAGVAQLEQSDSLRSCRLGVQVPPLAPTPFFSAWRSPAAHLSGGQGAAGSNPAAETIFSGEMPERSKGLAC